MLSVMLAFNDYQVTTTCKWFRLRWEDQHQRHVISEICVTATSTVANLHFGGGIEAMGVNVG